MCYYATTRLNAFLVPALCSLKFFDQWLSTSLDAGKLVIFWTSSFVQTPSAASADLESPPSLNNLANPCFHDGAPQPSDIIPFMIVPPSHFAPAYTKMSNCRIRSCRRPAFGMNRPIVAFLYPVPVCIFNAWRSRHLEVRFAIKCVQISPGDQSTASYQLDSRLKGQQYTLRSDHNCLFLFLNASKPLA